MKIKLYSSLFCPLDAPEDYENQFLEGVEQLAIDNFTEEYIEKFKVDPPQESAPFTIYPYVDNRKTQKQLAKDWVDAYNRYIDENSLPTYFKGKFTGNGQPLEHNFEMSWAEFTVDMTQGQRKATYESVIADERFVEFINNYEDEQRYHRLTFESFKQEFWNSESPKPLSAAILFLMLHKSYPFGVTGRVATPDEAVENFRLIYEDECERSESNGLYSDCLIYPVEINELTESIKEENLCLTAT